MTDFQKTPTYSILRATAPVTVNGDWNGPAWDKIPTLDVACFHPRTGDHRPKTQAKLSYDAHALNVIFRVEDRYVRSVRTDPQSFTCMDSCVEFFVEPRAEGGYFNFEINAGGALLLHYHSGDRSHPSNVHNKIELPLELLKKIPIYHSLPSVVEPERTEPTLWVVQFSVPWIVFEAYVGLLGELAGQHWRANFYKCGEETSHPHWASWAPIGEKLDFHQLRYFGDLTFA